MGRTVLLGLWVVFLVLALCLPGRAQEGCDEPASGWAMDEMEALKTRHQQRMQGLEEEEKNEEEEKREEKEEERREEEIEEEEREERKEEEHKEKEEEQTKEKEEGEEQHRRTASHTTEEEGEKAPVPTASPSAVPMYPANPIKPVKPSEPAKVVNASTEPMQACPQNATQLLKALEKLLLKKHRQVREALEEAEEGKCDPEIYMDECEEEEEPPPIVEEGELGPFHPDWQHMNVFIVPHTHDGALSSYGKVAAICSSVVDTLSHNKKRTFNWAQIGPFASWYAIQNNTRRDQVKKLVTEGQLEFVEGGWVMPDETVVNLPGLVNQMTVGHDFLLKHFGVRPRIGWQVDSFGSVGATASLFAQFGFDALVNNRIEFDLKDLYKQQQHLEFVWRGSRTLGKDTEIFTHTLDSHFSSPVGFDFEGDSKVNAPITDDNVRDRADIFAEECHKRGAWFRTPNLLVPFGGVSRFVNAETMFANMDKLLAFVNANKDRYNITIKYATASEYFDAVHNANKVWPVFEGDFLPYATDADSYWTGLYSSRPALKGFSRMQDAVQRSAETAYVLARTLRRSHSKEEKWIQNFGSLRTGRTVQGLVQNYDAITGVSGRDVVKDYTRIVREATATAATVLEDSVSLLLAPDGDRVPQLTVYANATLGPIVDTVPVVVYNPLGWERTRYVWLVITQQSDLHVTDASGRPVTAQLIPLVGSDTCKLFFEVHVPALGAATYFVHAGASDYPARLAESERIETYCDGEGEEEFSIENALLRLSFEANTGLIKNVHDKRTGRDTPVIQRFRNYHATAREAYNVFRPEGPASLLSNETSVVYVHRGPLVQEVKQVFLAKQLNHTIRLYHGPEPMGLLIEVVHEVGPMSTDTQLVTTWATSWPTMGVFYTDNGQEMRARLRDPHVPDRPIAANVFPHITTSYVEHTSQRLTVLSRQSMAASSQVDGALEFMLQRNLAGDDNSDTTWMSIPFLLMVGTSQESDTHRHRAMMEHNFPLMKLVGAETTIHDWVRSYNLTFAPVAEALPDTVDLLTLQMRDKDTEDVYVRLAHLAEAGEDVPALATVHLPGIFGGARVTAVREKTLSMNTDKSTLDRLAWRSYATPKDRIHAKRQSVDLSSLTDIQLGPQQIRSFVLELSSPALSVSSTAEEDVDPMREAIRQLYNVFDADHDGMLVKDEVRNLLRTVDPEVQWTDAMLDHTFRYLDADASGGVSFDELWDLYEANGEFRTDEDKRRFVESTFRTFDTDSDGYLNVNEVIEMLRQLEGDVTPDEEIIRMIVNFADTDGDGLLDPDEFFTAYEHVEEEEDQPNTHVASHAEIGPAEAKGMRARLEERKLFATTGARLHLRMALDQIVSHVH